MMQQNEPTQNNFNNTLELAHWVIVKDDGFDYWAKCSLCETRAPSKLQEYPRAIAILSRYCPVCGALMDDKVERMGECDINDMD